MVEYIFVILHAHTYCSKSKSSTIVFYSEHSQTLPVKLSATFTIEEHDCPLQEAYGIVSHFQDVDEGSISNFTA